MTTELIPLALLMLAVTYPSRSVGLLAPGLDRLPRRAFEYLQLVGPSVLAALGAVGVLVVTTEGAPPAFRVGIEAIAVATCLALTAWRKNLLIGILAAVAIVVVARWPPG